MCAGASGHTCCARRSVQTHDGLSGVSVFTRPGRNASLKTRNFLVSDGPGSGEQVRTDRTLGSRSSDLELVQVHSPQAAGSNPVPDTKPGGAWFRWLRPPCGCWLPCRVTRKTHGSSPGDGAACTSTISRIPGTAFGRERASRVCDSMTFGTLLRPGRSRLVKGCR